MTEDTITASQRWAVRDGARKIEFTGVLLAETSSATPRKNRWSELRVYRTDGGNYIVERNGRTRNKGERDYLHAYVCETAAAVVETLYTKDREGAWYFTRMADCVLTVAGRHDHDIEEAYHTEDVG